MDRESLTREQYEDWRHALSEHLDDLGHCLRRAREALAEVRVAELVPGGYWSAAEAGVDTSWLRDVDGAAGLPQAYADVKHEVTKLKEELKDWRRI